MQGDEAKYAMRIDHDRFSMESDDFQVELCELRVQTTRDDEIFVERRSD